MLAGSQFRHHPTIGLMGGNLREYDVGDDFLAGAHHGRRGLIAGALDPEDVSAEQFVSSLNSLQTRRGQPPKRALSAAEGVVRMLAGRTMAAIFMLKDFAISIIRTLRDHGHKAFLVGGCVRDLLP